LRFVDVLYNYVSVSLYALAFVCQLRVFTSLETY